MAAEDVHRAAAEMAEPVAEVARMLGAHDGVDFENLPERAGGRHLSRVLHRVVVAVHVGELNHQALAPGVGEELLECREVFAGGLVDVHVQVAIDAALRRRDEIPHIGLDQDGGEAWDVQEFLLGHERQPLIDIERPARLHPRRIGLANPDDLEHVGEAARCAHLLRSVVVPDADLGDFDFVHRLLPLSIQRTCRQSKTTPSGAWGSSASRA